MLMNILFKETKPENAALIRNLALQVWPGTFSSILSQAQIDYMLEWMYNEKQLSDEITRQQIRYDLMFADEKPAGYVSYGPGKSDDDLKLHKLYVLPEFQRHGIGRRAFTRVQSFAAATNRRFVILQVNRKNLQAISAYRLYGFRVRAEAVTDIGNGFVMDDYIMECPVS